MSSNTQNIDYKATFQYMKYLETKAPELKGITEIAFQYSDCIKFCASLQLHAQSLGLVHDDIRPVARRYANRLFEELIKELISRIETHTNNNTIAINN